MGILLCKKVEISERKKREYKALSIYALTR